MFQNGHIVPTSAIDNFLAFQQRERLVEISILPNVYKQDPRL